MQTINDRAEAEAFLRSVKTSMMKDTLYWRNWWLVTITTEEQEELSGASEAHFLIESKRILDESLAGKSATLLNLGGGTIFIFCKDFLAIDYARLNALISTETTLAYPFVNVRSICIDTSKDAAMKLIDEHLKNTNVFDDINKPEPSKWAEEQIKGLSEIFSCNISGRKSRQPSYILLVDDDPFARKIVANLLKQEFQLITAYCAEKAAEQYMIYAPDLVLLDINMPEHDGFELLTAIKQHDPSACIVMFSGNESLEAAVKAAAGGASGYICKPFKKDHLMHHIRKMEQNKHTYGATA